MSDNFGMTYRMTPNYFVEVRDCILETDRGHLTCRIMNLCGNIYVQPCFQKYGLNMVACEVPAPRQACLIQTMTTSDLSRSSVDTTLLVNSNCVLNVDDYRQLRNLLCVG